MYKKISKNMPFLSANKPFFYFPHPILVFFNQHLSKFFFQVLPISVKIIFFLNCYLRFDKVNKKIHTILKKVTIIMTVMMWYLKEKFF